MFIKNYFKQRMYINLILFYFYEIIRQNLELIRADIEIKDYN